MNTASIAKAKTATVRISTEYDRASYKDRASIRGGLFIFIHSHHPACFWIDQMHPAAGEARHGPRRTTTLGHRNYWRQTSMLPTMRFDTAKTQSRQLVRISCCTVAPLIVGAAFRPRATPLHKRVPLARLRTLYAQLSQIPTGSCELCAAHSPPHDGTVEISRTRSPPFVLKA